MSRSDKTLNKEAKCLRLRGGGLCINPTPSTYESTNESAAGGGDVAERAVTMSQTIELAPPVTEFDFDAAWEGDVCHICRNGIVCCGAAHRSKHTKGIPWCGETTCPVCGDPICPDCIYAIGKKKAS